MKDFKFFSGNQDDESLLELSEYGEASWIYGKVEHLNQYRYDILVDNHYGIHSFLNHFPPGFVVCIISITGPNGRQHTIDTEYEDGWGFDILSDLITIEWVRFRNDNEL